LGKIVAVNCNETSGETFAKRVQEMTTRENILERNKTKTGTSGETFVRRSNAAKNPVDPVEKHFRENILEQIEKWFGTIVEKIIATQLWGDNVEKHLRGSILERKKLKNGTKKRRPRTLTLLSHRTHARRNSATAARDPRGPRLYTDTTLALEHHSLNTHSTPVANLLTNPHHNFFYLFFFFLREHCGWDPAGTLTKVVLALFGKHMQKCKMKIDSGSSVL